MQQFTQFTVVTSPGKESGTNSSVYFYLLCLAKIFKRFLFPKGRVDIRLDIFQSLSKGLFMMVSPILN